MSSQIPESKHATSAWPWMDGPIAAADALPPGKAWPRITIVTPSYNQGQYIEETIRSILMQGYPNLEYIIIDGGSTDDTCDIIRKYESRLAFWVSERDRGQTHAINKGFERATGEIHAYLNSDDYYLPGTLHRVARYAMEHPQIDMIHGQCRRVDVDGVTVDQQFASISCYEEIVDLWKVWWGRRQFVQPEVFWTKRIAERIGPFREELRYVMDYEYWTRMLFAGAQVGSIDAELSCFRLQPAQKSGAGDEVDRELLDVVRPMIWDRQSPLPWKQRMELQGAWLFDASFRREALNSVSRGESRLRRWWKLGWLTLTQPQLFAAPGFRKHLVQNAIRHVRG